MKCEYCDDAGVIETDNNGPIGPCPVCQSSRSPGCYAREEEVENPPKRAVVLTAEIGGDTWRDVSDALLAIADRIEREGPITTLISGGYTSGYVLTGVEKPDQTGDKYRQQNAEYVRQLKAAKRAYTE